MLRKFFIGGLLILLSFTVAIAGERNYVSPDDFKNWIEGKKEMVIVDIQEEEAFQRQHFPGSIETNAFPVKTDAERAKIDVAVQEAKKSGHDVVVICPRGGGGANRCYDYLKEQGIPEEKLYILTKGIDNFPHRTLLEGSSSN